MRQEEISKSLSTLKIFLTEKATTVVHRSFTGWGALKVHVPTAHTSLLTGTASFSAGKEPSHMTQCFTLGLSSRKLRICPLQ